MLLLWVALTIGLYCTHTLLVQWMSRCFVRGCPRRAKPDRLWCSLHDGLIREESRRVGQTAESSSAHSLSDASSTRDREPHTPHGTTGARYSSPAGLRLVHRCVDCGRPATYAACEANRGGLHRIEPRRLNLVRPYDQEESP